MHKLGMNFILIREPESCEAALDVDILVNDKGIASEILIKQWTWPSNIENWFSENNSLFKIKILKRSLAWEFPNMRILFWFVLSLNSGLPISYLNILTSSLYFRLSILNLPYKGYLFSKPLLAMTKKEKVIKIKNVNNIENMTYLNFTIWLDLKGFSIKK